MLELNRIYNMDCLEGLGQVDSSSVDLVLTSPPYDNLRKYKGFVFNNEVFLNLIKDLYRVLKPGGVVVWVVADATVKGSETGTSFKQALEFKNAGFNLHDTMIYAKKSASYPDKLRYNNIFEYMFVFSKGKPKTINLIQDKPNKYFGDKLTASYRQVDGSLKKSKGYGQRTVKEIGIRNNIWTYDCGFLKTTRDLDAYQHPAMFPEKLAEDHILSWSNPCELVLDPMIGSGTTAKMAMLNQRHFLGFEISAEYCSLANKRIFQYSGEN